MCDVAERTGDLYVKQSKSDSKINTMCFSNMWNPDLNTQTHHMCTHEIKAEGGHIYLKKEGDQKVRGDSRRVDKEAGMSKV